VNRHENGKPASEISGGGLPKNEQLGGQLSFPNNESVTPTQVPSMSKGERTELQQLLRQRERVQKSAAKQRSADLLADFENQMASEFSFDDDAVWAKAKAEVEVRKAKIKIAARCRELGIPDRFAPTLSMSWVHRGYDNMLGKRRDELRRVATTKIESIERSAITQIEVSSLDAQTNLASAGLTSEAAHAFIQALPSVADDDDEDDDL
jgi:hypothetical protein